MTITRNAPTAQGFLDDAPAAAQDVAALSKLMQELTMASLVGHIDFETRMGIAMDLLEVTDRLRSYAMRVRG